MGGNPPNKKKGPPGFFGGSGKKPKPPLNQKLEMGECPKKSNIIPRKLELVKRRGKTGGGTGNKPAKEFTGKLPALPRKGFKIWKVNFLPKNCPRCLQNCQGFLNLRAPGGLIKRAALGLCPSRLNVNLNGKWSKKPRIAWPVILRLKGYGGQCRTDRTKSRPVLVTKNCLKEKSGCDDITSS